METPSLATPTKKLGTLCLDDKENQQPEEKPVQKPDEKKVDKFPVPKMTPDTGDDGPREPLSPKKGFKVNTSSMPAYMRATASSSVKKTNTKRNLTGIMLFTAIVLSLQLLNTFFRQIKGVK